MHLQRVFLSCFVLLVIRTVDAQFANFQASQTFPTVNSPIFFPNQNFPPMTIPARPNTFVSPLGMSNTGMAVNGFPASATLNNGFVLNPMPNIGIPRTFPTFTAQQGTGTVPSPGNNIQQVTNNNQQTGTIKAIAVLRGSTSAVTGIITFVQRPPNRNVVVSGTVNNLLPGEHGFHIHELGDLSDGCTSTGPHFNPYNVQHGNISDAVRHVGDLGNINAYVGLAGRADVNIVDNRIQLTGPDSIIGRAVVVHSGRDDLGRYNNDGSRRHGNAGSRLACGVIGLSKDAVNR